MGAHPRSRGEHTPLSSVTWNARGSSPLARGTPMHQPGRNLRRGLIPARAGNTHLRGVHLRSFGAHPRSRGEHIAGVSEDKYRAGSSPLARGTHPTNVPVHPTNGLIPARAGNTSESFPDGNQGGAHPRSRGEHLRQLHRFCIVAGSSPLARGTLHWMHEV